MYVYVGVGATLALAVSFSNPVFPSLQSLLVAGVSHAMYEAPTPYVPHRVQVLRCTLNHGRRAML